MTTETLSRPSIEQNLLANKERLREGAPTVIKIGGVEDVAGIFKSIAFLQREVGMKFVVVHGGGSEIDKELQKRGIEIPKKINGLRPTDRKTLGVVVDVLDRINGEMVEALRQKGVPAVAYDSASRIIIARKKNASLLGFVGKVSSVDKSMLAEDLKDGFTPVVSPIGVWQSDNDQFLNINADGSAGAVAKALGSNLVLVTKVEGVLDSNRRVIKSFDLRQFREMQRDGVITGGMIPKLESVSGVVAAGGTAIICQASDFLYAFSGSPRGTVLKPKQ